MYLAPIFLLFRIFLFPFLVSILFWKMCLVYSRSETSSSALSAEKEREREKKESCNRSAKKDNGEQMCDSMSVDWDLYVSLFSNSVCHVAAS